MSQSLPQLFDKIWKQYTSLTPQAAKIHRLLKDRGDSVFNDHVAYRSVNLKGFGIEALKAPFLNQGYTVCGDYKFEKKKLYAVHLEHEDKTQPKVFISELLLDQLSKEAQKIYEKALYYTELPGGEESLTCGRPWEASYADYQKLSEESEYAAWLFAYGYCANHFTVNVNELKSFESLESLNAFVEAEGFVLNASGGKIKGSPEVFLEQSSTMASKKTVAFAEGDYEVPSCYYEFAKRYENAPGRLYQGFVTGSADKIFESTNSKD